MNDTDSQKNLGIIERFRRNGMSDDEIRKYVRELFCTTEQMKAKSDETLSRPAE